MLELLNARDWSSTPLGRTSTWSPVLRVMVPTMLRSGFPAVINWGPEMVALYNDAYVPLLGRKHPQAVGQSTKDTWPEAWEWVAPRLEQVLRAGRTERMASLKPSERWMVVPVLGGYASTAAGAGKGCAFTTSS